MTEETQSENTTAPAPSDDPMRQTTIDLVTIIDNHQHHEPEEVMSGLMRFERALREAVEQLKGQLSQNADPRAVFDAISAPMELAMRFGAGDLVAVSQRASQNFTPILKKNNATLQGPAAADAIVWMTVAEQTRVAVKMLFHASLLHGRAPNGKRLPTT